ncbi:MAG: hypothetical protein K1X78_00640 [Verrucomicrobiaceae bacterium]|nr:hypothetical protein [Verrucomicrobiaceae bacterium]
MHGTHRILSLVFKLLPCIVATGAAAQQLDVAKIFDERNLLPVASMVEAGEYDLGARICDAAIKRDQPSVVWRLLRMRALAATGQTGEALTESAEFIKKFPEDLPLLMLRHDLAAGVGKKDIAKDALAKFNDAAKKKPVKDRTAAELVALGQGALALGADAKKVLANYFDAAKKKDAKAEEPYVAAGELALQKEDFARAADEFRKGLKEHGETTALRFGLARAFESSDREKADENLKRVLEINQKHEGALLVRAEQLMGAEKFVEAEAAIQSVIDVNEHSARAWALRSAIASILVDGEKARASRDSALALWPQNPLVDQVIGRCLSRAYRFAEAAEHLRASLAFDATHLPAKVQLCHVLMRLGKEDEAWKLADEIRSADGYNLQAHNIGLLEKEVAKFSIKQFDDFVIKLPERDWNVYGSRALTLLREARTVLCERYGLTLDHPVLVEFFPSQQDFAIRTFGNLGGQGILGACFGSVVTMNQPGGLAHGRNNWESTLWHEFCHVVTLTVTKNRMPRWLSEGISVYEEAQRDPAWGMNMNAKYRKMITDEEALTAMSQMSGAFLHPKSEDHLMFAYYEASQAVKFLLDKFGKEKFQGILRDLAAGKRINDAITANTQPVEKIEKEFAALMEQKAADFGGKLDWKQPTPEEVNPLDEESFAAFLKKNPTNRWALMKSADDLLESKEWKKAAEIGQKLIDLVPDDISTESGYFIKAKALRQMNQRDQEAELLRYFASRASDAMPIFLRLLELDTAAKRWPEVLANANRATALNPFLKSPQQSIAEALDATGQADAAIEAWRRLLILEPDNPADTNYRLAKLLHGKDDAAARRHLIDALVLAPRFRDAHRLLLEMAK